jgi:hypothetical protein
MLGEAREDRAAAHGSVVSGCSAAAPEREEWEAGVAREDEMVNEVGERGRSGALYMAGCAEDAGMCRGAWWGVRPSAGGRVHGEATGKGTERRPTTVSYSIMVWSNDAVADSTYGTVWPVPASLLRRRAILLSSSAWKSCRQPMPPSTVPCMLVAVVKLNVRHRPEKQPHVVVGRFQSI